MEKTRMIHRLARVGEVFFAVLFFSFLLFSRPVAAGTVTPVSTPAAVPAETKTPALQSETKTESGADSLENFKRQLEVKGFRISIKDKKYIQLDWDLNPIVKGYKIYRSASKEKGYQLIRTVNRLKTSYIDKDVCVQKTYYYKIKAIGKSKGIKVEGAGTRVYSILIPEASAPEITVKKRKLGDVRYIEVTLKRYEGAYADIFISMNGKKFSRLKLVSNKISRYKGKFKIQYMVKNKSIRLKVRTYKKKGKKKVYSRFSKVVRIQV